MDSNPLELIKAYKENKKKPKIVRRHKYEKLGQNNQIWWNNKFKELEAEIRVPFHKKDSELRNAFTTSELECIEEAGLINVNNENEEKYFSDKQRSYARKSTMKSNYYLPRRRTFLPTKRNVLADRLTFFFKKSPEEVRIWSSKHKRDLDKTVHLLKRAAIVEEELAEDFDKWFNNIKTYTTSETNKDTILNIFEINSSLDIHKAIVVNMQQINSVTSHVAKFLGHPELASRVALKRLIDSDIKASKIEPVNIAFNKLLPPSMRQYKHISEDKIKITSDHTELETFAAVFQDIMELETSKKFVVWLQNHSEIKPPPFLQKLCMTPKSKLSKKSMYIRQIYEAKVWAIENQSQLASIDSNSSINFLV